MLLGPAGESEPVSLCCRLVWGRPRLEEERGGRSLAGSRKGRRLDSRDFERSIRLTEAALEQAWRESRGLDADEEDSARVGALAVNELLATH